MCKKTYVENLKRIHQELKDLVNEYYKDKDAKTTYDGGKETTYHVDMVAFADGGNWILTTDEEVEKCLKK